MTKTLKIEGMTCMHCVAAVKKELEKLGGVDSVAVSLEEKNAVVSFFTDQITDDILRAAVDEAGYQVTGIE